MQRSATAACNRRTPTCGGVLLPSHDKISLHISRAVKFEWDSFSRVGGGSGGGIHSGDGGVKYLRLKKNNDKNSGVNLASGVLVACYTDSVGQRNLTRTSRL